jgi:hypothetical protein
LILDAWLRGLANRLIRAKQAMKYCLEGRKKRMKWNDRRIGQGGRCNNQENLRQGERQYWREYRDTGNGRGNKEASK